MEANNEIMNDFAKLEETWIQPSIDQLDLSFFTQKIIDGIYSVIDGKPSEHKVSQSWFWEDDWQIGEQKVDDYIRLGKVEDFDSMDDFLKSLQE